jgi:hypothetical protein
MHPESSVLHSGVIVALEARSQRFDCVLQANARKERAHDGAPNSGVILRGDCSGEGWVEWPTSDDGFESGEQRHALLSEGGKVASEARERIGAPLGAETA